MDADFLDSAFAGRFRVERTLGAGGMAMVYLAHDPRQDREVAIKVMRPEVASGLGAERFAREIAIAGRLSHPNILPVFDSGAVVVDGLSLPYYTMPYVQGEALRARLARERQLPVEDALRIARDVGEALDFAHATGIVHRDVKPENILLVGSHALLADFGVALAIEGASHSVPRLTGTGIALGTPAYMSPEQSVGDQALDGRTDLYSLAVVAYEMLAGQTPFTGVTPQAIRARQMSGEVLPLATIRPRAVTAPMDEAFARALAPSPADRFASAREFVAALEVGHAARAPGRRGATRDRGRRAIVLGGVTVAIVAAGVLAVRGVPPFGATASDPRVGVALMPFRAIAGAAEWSEALPDFVSTFLDGTPGVRVADPGSLWRPLRPTSDARARSPDAEEADRLARRAGVGQFVLGSVVRSGARLDLSLRIYGVGVLQPIASFALFGSVDSIASLAQRTAVELMQRVWEGDGGPVVPKMESLLTQLPDALKAYLSAREAMRRGLPDSADVAITRAIALDSTFALALLEGVTVRSWVQYMRGQPYSGLRQLALRASAFADSLTPRQRLRLEATTAAIETDGSANAAAWQRLLALDSTDLDANKGLAGATLQYGWQFGADPDELLRATERAVRLDSTDATSLALRAAVALGRWDPEDARHQLARLRAVGSNAPIVLGYIRAIEASLATDQQFAARVDSLADAPMTDWVGIFRVLRSYRPDRALSLAERTASRSTPGPKRDLGISGWSGLLLGAGDVRAADSIWTGSATGGTPTGRLRHAQRVLAAALLGVEDSAVTARALRELSALIPIDSALAYFDARPSWTVAWSLGTWHAERGDTLLAKRWLEIVPRFPGGGSPAMWRESIAADIAARLAARRGALDSARVLTARAFALWTIHTGNVSDWDVEPALRYRHARALLDVGLADSAARVLGSFVPPTSWIGAYVPQARLLLGAIAERRGDTETAARHFQEARELLALGGRSSGGLRARADSGARRMARVRLFRYGEAR